MIDYVGNIVLCDFGLAKLNMMANDTTNSTSPPPSFPPLPLTMYCSVLWDPRVPRARALARTRIPEDGRLVDSRCVSLSLSLEMLLTSNYAGVLLYEMLSGLPPFYSENTNEMYQKVRPLLPLPLPS